MAIVSGIGCSSRAAGYLNFQTLHTTHGRALAFATGLKMVRPELTIFVLMGDGDSTAIGGNHFIHTARRNIDVNAIIFNNQIYGMTGGQASPLTPQGKKGSTAPFGCTERNFDIMKLAMGAGATFAARSTTYHLRLLDKMIEEGVNHKGFSVVEAMTYCPTGFGRQNKSGSAAAMLNWYKDHAVPVEKAAVSDAKTLKERITIGIHHQEQEAEFVSEYEKIIESQKQKSGGSS
ncbi:thiamine pyrophosphate-dependent enzyme [Dethiobacter alkaliphilus]|uniref:thiamine pyrophosphate-dependent enzyme n=1 Tax=Dethiobacter alkaliphilus TaxID=427926 RepID=UPI002227D9D2|nr:thiamine pyrophosphate-dependent enzyme [Dethiobacter alkaliphilus]MCW3489688.1 thiamine pyrophosphate-dependent enzyme [Dethiobacter alkaliphilus]